MRGAREVEREREEKKRAREKLGKKFVKRECVWSGDSLKV